MSEQITAATKIVEEVVARSQQALEELIKTSRQQSEKAGETLKTGLGEITDLGNKNLDALVQSTKIFARGVEEASQAVLAFSQKSSEASLSALTKLASAKSVTEATEIQQAYAKESVSALVSEAERLAALTATTARNAVAPLSERVTATVDKLSKPV